jgi:hypothetical protein
MIGTVAIEACNQIADVLQSQQLSARQFDLEGLLDSNNQIDVRKGVPAWHVVGCRLGADSQRGVVENALEDLIQLLERRHEISLLIGVLHTGSVTRILAEHFGANDPSHDLATPGARQMLTELQPSRARHGRDPVADMKL